jgi:hypothetical protein
MKRNYLFVSLTLLIIFIFPLSCAYSLFNTLTEADFLTTGVKYEAADTEDLFIDKQNIVGVMPSPFFVCMFMETELFASPLDISLPTSLQGLSYSILRC